MESFFSTAASLQYPDRIGETMTSAVNSKRYTYWWQDGGRSKKEEALIGQYGRRLLPNLCQLSESPGLRTIALILERINCGCCCAFAEFFLNWARPRSTGPNMRLWKIWRPYFEFNQNTSQKEWDYSNSRNPFLLLHGCCCWSRFWLSQCHWWVSLRKY